MRKWFHAGANYVEGTDRADVYMGSAKSEEIYGLGGNDKLWGGGGNDGIYGGVGNDTLWGGAGNDVLVGDFGNDVLKGGAGSDTFVFMTGYDTDGRPNPDFNQSRAGKDVVKDFKPGQDKLDFTMMDSCFGDTIHNFKELKAASHNVNGNLVIDIEGGKITLEHIKISDLSDRDIIYHGDY